MSNDKEIIGGVVALGLPKPDLMQTDPKKGDYVYGKDEFVAQFGGSGSADGEFLPQPASAYADQYLRVKSVDENGNVTAVEAVHINAETLVPYLYNGIKLPALVNWDKDLLPYATMYWHTISETYLVYYHSTKWIRKMIVKTYKHFPETPGLICGRLQLDPKKDVNWSVVGGKVSESWGDQNSESWDLDTFVPVWTNYDSLNEDGTLYFAGSEPVPAYIDDTLTMPGKAADAKAVGDALGNISELLDAIIGEVI